MQTYLLYTAIVYRTSVVSYNIKDTTLLVYNNFFLQRLKSFVLHYNAVLYGTKFESL
jgi:hypothetical protein